MRTQQFSLVFLLIFQYFWKISECLRSDARTITLNKFSNCSGEETNPIHFNGNFTKIARNMYTINGIFTLEEVISAPIEVKIIFMMEYMFISELMQFLLYFQLQIIANRCDFNMTKCENLNTFILKDVCALVNQSAQIWSDTVAHTYPRPKCPLNMPTVKIINGTIDFGYISYFPIDGYTWTFHFKAFKSIANLKYKKQMLWCLMTECTITKNRRERKKDQQKDERGTTN